MNYAIIAYVVSFFLWAIYLVVLIRRVRREADRRG